MRMKVFAIKDRALGAFMQPFFMHTEGQAIRAFQDNINDKESNTNKHPDDYDLWLLADFDDQLGAFFNDNKGDQILPRQLVLGKQVVK